MYSECDCFKEGGYSYSECACFKEGGYSYDIYTKAVILTTNSRSIVYMYSLFWGIQVTGLIHIFVANVLNKCSTWHIL